MKLLLSLLALVIILTGCATKKLPYLSEDGELVQQPLKAIHFIDRNGTSETISNPERLCKYEEIDFLQPQPYTKVLRAFGDAHAIITSYYDNGQPRQYLEILNNRAHGQYREWFDNGQLHVKAFVIGGSPDTTKAAEETWLFDGPCRAWDPQGNLTAVINYVKGKLEGDSLYYHSDGKIWKRAHFCGGELEGTVEVFYNDGQLLQNISYEHNKPHGIALRYWQDGSLSTEEEYSHGSLLSGHYYGKSGALVSSIDDGKGLRTLFGAATISEQHEYNNGESEGEVRQFDNEGRVVRRWHVRDGIKHGVATEYYIHPVAACGKPKLEVSWSEGKLCGSVKTWYPDGGLESQREMSNNAKNGLALSWYRDGSLMLVEEYENDRLIKGEYYRRGEGIPAAEVIDGDGVAHLYDADGNFLRKVHYCQSKPFE